MILYIDGHDYHYELESLCNIFLPYEKIKVVDTLPTDTDPHETIAITRMTEETERISMFVSLKMEGVTKERTDCFTKEELAGEPFDKICGVKLAFLLYHLFVEFTGYTPKWGVLTGVRPVKLLRKLAEEQGEESAVDYFRNILLVSTD